MADVDSLTPTIIKAENVQDLLKKIAFRNASSSTIVVCATREQFLRGLVQSPSDTPAVKMELMLGYLSKAKEVAVTYCPTVEHLRAFLAMYAMDDAATGSTLADQKDPLLVLLNAIQLHHGITKSEDVALNAWEINRTIATAVDATRARKTKLVIYEPQEFNWNETSGLHSGDIWTKEIPVLPPGVRPPGISDNQWSPPSTTIQAVLGRWCLFDDSSDKSQSILD